MSSNPARHSQEALSVQRAIWARTWLVNEQDMTHEGWPVAHLTSTRISLSIRNLVSANIPEVDETSLSEKDEVTAGGHGVAVDLGLDVGDLGGGLPEPGDVNREARMDRMQ